MSTISSIKTNTDNYKLDEIGCFEKPFGIILESYKEKYSNAFYMFLKFYQSYNTEKYEFKSLTNFTSRMQVDVDIVNEIFNIECEKIRPEGNIHEFIQNKLMLNIPVLVPGNLKECYYSKQHKTGDQAHLFLIKGFDKAKHKYLILDSLHISDEGNKYDDFFMEEDTLELLYESCSKDMEIKDMYYFTPQSNENSISIDDIVIQCINLYENNLTKQPYKEIDYINTLSDLIENNDDMNSNITIEKQGVTQTYTVYSFVMEMKNTVKFKNVFLSELITNLSFYIVDSTFLEKLTEKKSSVIKKWNEIIDITIGCLYRGKLFNVSKELDDVIEEEKQLQGLISEAKSILVSLSKKYDNPSKSNDLVMEKEVLPKREVVSRASVEYAAARNKTEEKLVEIWSEVLEVEKLGIDDDFFALGGHSLKAIEILSKLEEYGINLKVSDIYDNYTIRQIGSLISDKGLDEEPKSVENKEIDKSNLVQIIELNKNDKSNIISGVVENDDKYSWEELGCFYKPIAIILKYFKPEYFDLFLFHVSYYNSFMADGCFSDVMQTTMEESFFEFYKNILDEKLEIKFDKFEYSNAEEMHKKIKDQIDNDCPVLVPGDLIELNYYPLYKDATHNHFFIIKGYNMEKGIYNILDNIHIDNGASTIYKDFYVSFNDLEKMNKVYCENLPSNNSKAYSFSLVPKNDFGTNDFNFYDAMLEHSSFLEEVNSNESKITYLEYKIVEDVEKAIESLDSRIEEVNDYMWVISCMANFKKVYYDILFKYLDGLKVSKVKIDSLKDMKDELLSSWRNIRFDIMSRVFKKDFNFNNVKRNIEINKSKEAVFRSTLIAVIKDTNIKELINLQNNKVNDIDFIEYNKNNAEILKTKDSFKFIIKEDNKCDIWLSVDQGPQMLKTINNNDFSIEGKLDLNYEPHEVAFHDGIIMKYGSGMKILFGIVKENHKFNKLVIYYPSNNEYIIYEEPYLDRESICLKVEKIKDDYLFYKKKDNESNWEKIFIITVNNLIKNVGFFSKTWEYGNHSIEISDIKFS